MKRFLQTFALCLLLVDGFLFFGGYMLFDFGNHFFLAGGSVAFLLAVIISVWLGQEDRIEDLKKRIDALENLDNLENKENRQ